MSDLPRDLEELQARVEQVAKDYGLDFFPVIFEMVDSDQMNSLAAQGGFPVRYPHWRFGMEYDQLSKGYSWGLQKIYEMVINTNPSYAYLMKNNSMTDQKTVMAHVYGHVDFFKHNYWFSKTDRKMLDTMANNAVKIRNIMDRHGEDAVESFIDRCLSLENLIDHHLPFANPAKRSDDRQANAVEVEGITRDPIGRIRTDRSYLDNFLNPPEFIADQKKRHEAEQKKALKNPPEPMKDVLLFLLQNAPLGDWEYDILRIVRDEAYYFVPQMQTKIMNEGWASYWHSKMMTEKLADASEIVDFAQSHAGTMAMSPGRLNPYKLGLEIWRDIEDRWNRGRFGKEYEECEDLVKRAKWNTNLNLGRQKMFEVRRVCNDITFLDEYLTEDLVERLKLYSFVFNRRSNQDEIETRDYKAVREKLLAQLTNMGSPYIYVTDGNYENRGELLLWHKFQGADLDVKWARETMRNLSKIWKRPVNLETTVEGTRKVYSDRNGEFSEKTL